MAICLISLTCVNTYQGNRTLTLDPIANLGHNLPAGSILTARHDSTAAVAAVACGGIDAIMPIRRCSGGKTNVTVEPVFSFEAALEGI